MNSRIFGHSQKQRLSDRQSLPEESKDERCGGRDGGDDGAAAIGPASADAESAIEGSVNEFPVPLGGYIVVDSVLADWPVSDVGDEADLGARGGIDLDIRGIRDMMASARKMRLSDFAERVRDLLSAKRASAEGNTKREGVLDLRE